MRRWARIAVTSRLFNAYLRRFLMVRENSWYKCGCTWERGSMVEILDLCEDQGTLQVSKGNIVKYFNWWFRPLGAYFPESLDKSQWCGADNTYSHIGVNISFQLQLVYLLVLLGTSTHVVVVVSRRRMNFVMENQNQNLWAKGSHRIKPLPSFLEISRYPIGFVTPLLPHSCQFHTPFKTWYAYSILPLSRLLLILLCIVGQANRNQKAPLQSIRSRQSRWFSSHWELDPVCPVQRQSPYIQLRHPSAPEDIWHHRCTRTCWKIHCSQELDCHWKWWFSVGILPPNHPNSSIVETWSHYNIQRVFNYNTQEKITSFEAHPE